MRRLLSCLVLARGARRRDGPAPFTLGVASGDATASSVILWTRLAPEPLTDGDGGLAPSVEVDWVVAEDTRLRRVVRCGTANATSGLAHSVHIDVTGLEPGRTCWYRFAALGRVSRIGRTRTAPAPGAARLRVGYVSCANFQHGEFAAYRHLAREDLDVVLCLGDYQYEYTAEEYGGYREHQGFETVTAPTGSNGQYYFNVDQWDGYLAERREVTTFLAEQEIPDTFFITGDIHSHWVHDVPADSDDDPGGPVVATEFVGTSITSDGFADLVTSGGGPQAGGDALEQTARGSFYASNPQLRFFEGKQHGYAVIEVTRDAITNTFRVISDRTDRFATVLTLASFRRARGSLLVEQVEGGMGNPRLPA